MWAQWDVRPGVVHVVQAECSFGSRGICTHAERAISVDRVDRARMAQIGAFGPL